MAFSVNFNGTDLGNIVDGFTSIQRDTTAGFTNNLQSSNGAPQTTRYGQDFLFNTVNTKTITVTYILHGTLADWTDKRNQIATLLNVTQPCPLIFGDEPVKVWQAVPDGNQTLSEDITTMTATGVLTFLVPSGVAESTYLQTLSSANSGSENGTITNNTDGSVTAIVNNHGTIETYPTIKLTMNDYDGYVGIVNATDVFQMGSIDQYLVSTKTTETTKYQSQWFLNPSGQSIPSNFTGFANTNDANMQGSTLTTGGTIGYVTDGLRLTSMGSAPSSGTWLTQGGFKKYTIPADQNSAVGAQYFSSYFNIYAWATKMGQTGLAQVLFTDSNSKLIAGFGIYKSDSKGNTAQAQYYVGGNNQRTFHTFNFESNNGEGKKSNRNINFNSGKGGVTITKSKNGTLSWKLTNTSQSLKVPELKNVKCAYIYVYIGQLKGRPADSKHYMGNLSVRKINFRKDDVALYTDSTVDVTTFEPGNSKQYTAGDILTIDMGASKIYKKDGTIPGNDELIIGSNFLTIPPGQSEIDFYFSDTMNTLPDIEISWNERFIQ